MASEVTDVPRVETLEGTTVTASLSQPLSEILPTPSLTHSRHTKPTTDNDSCLLCPNCDEPMHMTHQCENLDQSLTKCPNNTTGGGIVLISDYRMKCMSHPPQIPQVLFPPLRNLTPPKPPSSVQPPSLPPDMPYSTDFPIRYYVPKSRRLKSPDIAQSMEFPLSGPLRYVPKSQRLKNLES